MKMNLVIALHFIHQLFIYSFACHSERSEESPTAQNCLFKTESSSMQKTREIIFLKVYVKYPPATS